MNEKNHVKPKSGLKSLLGPMSSLLAVVAVTCLLASLGTWAAHSKLLAAPQPAVAAAASEPEVPAEAGNTAAETPVLPAPTATPVADAQPATALPTLEPGEESQAPSPPIHTPTPASTGTSLQHTVQQGETLGGVAQAYGVSVEALVAANDITNPDTIYAGQTLRIPTDGVTTPISATTPPADAPTPGASPALPSEVQEERWIDVDLSHRFPSERFGACRLASIHDDTVNAEPPRYWALCTVSRQIGQLWGVLESLRRLHLLGILANCYTSREIDVSEQRLTAYEGSTPVRTTLVSTGLPQTPTPVGQFRIWIKLRYDDMAGPGYYIEDVPFVMYFHEGYGLHGVTWHGNFGQPMSHGCINLPTPEAEWLFNWASVGTLVNIHG